MGKTVWLENRFGRCEKQYGIRIRPKPPTVIKKREGSVGFDLGNLTNTVVTDYSVPNILRGELET